jgi:hypothetical protein
MDGEERNEARLRQLALQVVIGLPLEEPAEARRVLDYARELLDDFVYRRPKATEETANITRLSLFRGIAPVVLFLALGLSGGVGLCVFQGHDLHAQFGWHVHEITEVEPVEPNPRDIAELSALIGSDSSYSLLVVAPGVGGYPGLSLKNRFRFPAHREAS